MVKNSKFCLEVKFLITVQKSWLLKVIFLNSSCSVTMAYKQQ